MAEKTTDLLEFLESLRRERAELDALIGGIEQRLDIAPASEPRASHASAPTPSQDQDSDAIEVGFFHNLSQAAAAEKLLRMNPGRPLKTPEILAAFRKGGMELNPKNAITILYTTLKRSKKFERVAGKAWGLSEWYPERKQRLEPGRRQKGRGVAEEPETDNQ